MAELVDALDSGSSEATHTGSTPAGCTNFVKIINYESTHLISGRI